MKENALITLEGTITINDESDVISLTTVGAYYQKNGKNYIIYKESEATGFEGYTTSIKAWDNGVQMKRYADAANPGSNLIIEKGAVNLCNYETVAGSLMLDIGGIDIVNSLDEKGGSLSFSYSLSAGGALISENAVNITVKEIN